MLDENKIKYINTDNGEGKPEDVMFVWGVHDFGFGTTTFYYEDGVLKCDNECISKESIKKLLCAFVDSAEFVDVPFSD